MNFQTFLAQLKADVFLAVLPLAGQAVAAIAANPTLPEIVGQWAALQVQVLAALPQLETTVIRQLAVAVNTEIQTAIKSATASTVKA